MLALNDYKGLVLTALLVAATGGHLAQLHQFRAKLIPPGEKVVWVTFDSPQSRSLLLGEVVEFVPYVAPRQYRRVVTHIMRAFRIIRKHNVDSVYSTGSGIALSFLPLARMLKMRAQYIESAARSQGPSVTGRVLRCIPGINLTTQYEAWADSRWSRGVSVFDDFLVVAPEKRSIRSVVVTLGTIQGFGFRSLVCRLLDIIPADVDVIWQTGSTDVTGLGIEGRVAMPQLELHGAMARADVVIAHSGIGSALSALQVGHVPILVPRRRSRHEHIDDHQAQIAHELDARGLAIHRDVENLLWSDLQAAANLQVEWNGAPGVTVAV